jgi:hypothetical protein
MRRRAPVPMACSVCVPEKLLDQRTADVERRDERRDKAEARRRRQVVGAADKGSTPARAPTRRKSH